MDRAPGGGWTPAEEFKERGFSVLAANGYVETLEKVKTSVDDRKLTHPVVLQGGTLARERYNVNAYLATFWLDGEGRVVEADMGFGQGNVPRMRAKTEELLKR